MSIVDISKSLDELAKAITQKNIEVDNLKKLYNHKISIINQYVEALTNDTDGLDTEMSEMKLIETLEKPMKCKKCEEEISLFDDNSDFVIIPKRKIRKVNINDTSSLNVTKDSSTTDKSNNTSIAKNFVYEIPKPEKKNQNNSYYKNKSKKTCSYCKKTGHTRAKCLVRLNNDC